MAQQGAIFDIQLRAPVAQYEAPVVQQAARDLFRGDANAIAGRLQQERARNALMYHIADVSGISEELRKLKKQRDAIMNPEQYINKKIELLEKAARDANVMYAQKLGEYYFDENNREIRPLEEAQYIAARLALNELITKKAIIDLDYPDKFSGTSMDEIEKKNIARQSIPSLRKTLHGELTSNVQQMDANTLREYIRKLDAEKQNAEQRLQQLQPVRGGQQQQGGGGN